MAEENLENEAESSAIAAFTLAQFAFWGLIESGIISTEKASDLTVWTLTARSFPTRRACCAPAEQ